MGTLTSELEKERVRIKGLAESVGLDFFETVFELVTYDQLNEIAACGGFPVRYPHWRWGMEYERLSKGYEYGLSKIYELVINNNPCYAYLMEGNEFIDQKLVMAHVYGHCDFFKNNRWFEQTNRKMLDTMANHATRIRKYQDLHGVDTVEDFIDKCLSIENLIDRYSPYTQVKVGDLKIQRADHGEGNASTPLYSTPRRYMESFIKSSQLESKAKTRVFPEKPEKDILNFILCYAPIEDWQQDVLSIIREESYYFSPQSMTKIMNEGWASFWHSKLMTEKIMNDSEIIDFADRHSGTMAMAPNGFNPYKIGIELFRNIKERWDKGQFGPKWNECHDSMEKNNWNTHAGQGMEKIYQVRRDYNDVTFIDEFLTEEFCIQNKMFVYKFNKRTEQFEVDTKDFKAIKSKLLFQLTNTGHPIISVVDANFENRGELLLSHLYEGVDMQPDYMDETMKNIYYIWKRPIHLATVMDGEGRIFRFDGQESTSTLFSDLPDSDTA